ncbi:hypothetical protein CLU79DRAFT_780581 [Phycomyces nitens]|nr:hypothetical protein CLU79DRAFT_780581 [Phycomyces nitens]
MKKVLSWYGVVSRLVALGLYRFLVSVDRDAHHQKLNEKHVTMFTFQEDGASYHTGSYTTWWKNR